MVAASCRNSLSELRKAAGCRHYNKRRMSDKTDLPFRAFNEYGEVRTYSHGFLPHWRQADCTYFVTFRLGDSVPQAVLREWEQERKRWMRKAGLNREEIDEKDWRKAYVKLPRDLRREFERQFSKRMHEYLDRGYGSCALRDPRCAKVVAEALDYFHPVRTITGDFAVMPNHVHVLLRPNAGFELEDMLHSIKSFTANRINKIVGEEGPLWQKESYDHIVRDGEELRLIQNYIRSNPEKAGLRDGEFVVSKAEYDLDA